MRVINIIASAYRATLEEQDDTIVWLSHTLRRAGADIDLLLRETASNYAIEGQQVRRLSIGGRTQRNAPDVHGAVRQLAEAGSRIFLIEEDIGRYGLSGAPRLPQAQLVASAELPALLSSYDSVWHW
jgi:hypothetical protein